MSETLGVSGSADRRVDRGIGPGEPRLQIVREVRRRQARIRLHARPISIGPGASEYRRSPCRGPASGPLIDRHGLWRDPCTPHALPSPIGRVKDGSPASQVLRLARCAAGQPRRRRAGGLRTSYPAIRCLECPVTGTDAPLPHAEIDAGVAGASARREHARRHDKRTAETKGRFGDRIRGVLLAITDDPQSTRAWERGRGRREACRGLEDPSRCHQPARSASPGTKGSTIRGGSGGDLCHRCQALPGTDPDPRPSLVFRSDERASRRQSRLLKAGGRIALAGRCGPSRARHGHRDSAQGLRRSLFRRQRVAVARPPKSFRGVILERLAPLARGSQSRRSDRRTGRRLRGESRIGLSAK